MDDLEYLLKLKEEMSGPAAKAAAEVAALNKVLTDEKKKLESLEGAMAQLHKQDAVSIADHRALAAAITKSKDAVSGLNTSIGKKSAAASLDAAIAKQKEIAKSDAAIAKATARRIADQLKLDKLKAADAAKILKARETSEKKAADAQTRNVKAAQAAAAKLEAKQAAAAKRLLADQKKIKQSTDKGNAATLSGLQMAIGAYATLAAVAVGAGAAGVGLTISAVSTAIAVTDAKFQAIGLLGTIKSVGPNAEKVFKKVRAISDELGVSEESAQKLAFELLKSGVAEKDLGGELAKRLNPTGIISFAAMMGKAWEKILRLFELSGSAVGDFRDAFLEVMSVFDEGRPVGDLLKNVIGGGVSYVMNVAKRALPFIRDLFLDLVIAALKFYIWLNPIVVGIRQWFAEGDRMRYVTLVFDGVATVLKVIGGILLFVIALWATMTAAGIAAVSSLYAAIGWLGEKFAEAKEWFHAFVMLGPTIASDFVEGFVRGLKEGVAKVKGAVTGVGESALSAIRGVFDSHSPSRVLFAFGKKDLMEDGLGGGIAAGAPVVARKMEDAAGPTLGAIGSMLGGGGGGSGGGGSAPSSGAPAVSLGGVAMNIHGVPNAESLREVIPAVAADMFEQLALQLGASLKPA